MRRHTPSLSCLLAFEASARHLSFTRAAVDLCVTQSAVSHLVKTLEEELGVLLFVREGKKLRLTATADAYLLRIRPCLAKLEAASVEIKAGRNSSSGRLSLAVLPSFAARWLMPRYPDFALRHPDIMVNITTRMVPFNFHMEDVDAAIHFGTASWPGAQLEFLLQDAVVPVCSPEFLAQYGPFDHPRKLLNCTLLHLASRTSLWQFWFESLGITDDAVLTGPVFEHYLMIVQVVTAGLGIGLVPYFLVAEDIAKGRLAVPYRHVASEPLAYYLAYPPEKKDYSPLAAFRAWLLEQIGSTPRAEDALALPMR